MTASNLSMQNTCKQCSSSGSSRKQTRRVQVPSHLSNAHTSVYLWSCVLRCAVSHVDGSEHHPDCLFPGVSLTWPHSTQRSAPAIVQ